jgi:general secretion pathway protein F
LFIIRLLSMRFTVRAVNTTQQLVIAEFDAIDEADARQQACASQLSVLSVRTQPQGLGRNSFSALNFVEELMALLEAGLHVTEAVDAQMEHAATESGRQVIRRLLQRLSEGLRLSAAMREQPEVFPALLVGVVQAAEGTSDLPRSLGRYVDYETRLDAVRHKIVSAAIYPAILLVVGGAVALFLVCYVVPSFASVYRGSGRALPWASQMLLGWGEFAGRHPLGLAVGGAGFLGAIALAMMRQWRRSGLMGMLRWLPGAGSRVETFELARLYLTLGMLLEGGIPIQHALGLSRAVLAPARQSALDAVRALVESGQPLSSALEQSSLSTPMALRLIRVGEKSGQLGNMLARTALFYDKENARWVERFTKTFEPVLMAGIGLVVGLIVLLLYMPIFDLAGTLQ